MSAQRDWVKAFAEQAKADLSTWKLLQDRMEVPACHKLHFFQMACEKLCKAHRLEAGARPAEIRSHAQISIFLGTIVRTEVVRLGGEWRLQRGLTRYVNQLVKELDALSPAITRGGKREDNCEYPWEDGVGKVHSPLRWSFPAATSLQKPEARQLASLLESALDNLME